MIYKYAILIYIRNIKSLFITNAPKSLMDIIKKYICSYSSTERNQMAKKRKCEIRKNNVIL